MAPATHRPRARSRGAQVQAAVGFIVIGLLAMGWAGASTVTGWVHRGGGLGEAPGDEEASMLFAVIHEHGPAWDASRPLREQAAWDEHAAFMDALADEGFIVLGGPLGDRRAVMVDRALLIVDAGTEDEVRTRLDGDPWKAMKLLEVASVEPWVILLGDPARLAPAGG
jgi:uncharacterized protein YciI